MVSDNGLIWDLKNQCQIKCSKSKRGWVRCHLWLNKVRKTIGLHRVVAMAFIGKSDLTVNHKDGNKENNNINNLEYMTRKEQNKHRSYVLKRGNRKRVICIENNKTYETIKEACEDLNLSYKNQHISSVCKHKYGFKSSYGYHFEYAV